MNLNSDASTVKDQLDYWQPQVGTGPGTHTLVGPNWITTLEKNSDSYQSLAESLGGEVHH